MKGVPLSFGRCRDLDLGGDSRSRAIRRCLVLGRNVGTLSRYRYFIFCRSDDLSKYGLDVGLRIDRHLPRWDLDSDCSSRWGRGLALS